MQVLHFIFNLFGHGEPVIATIIHHCLLFVVHFNLQLIKLILSHTLNPTLSNCLFSLTLSGVLCKTNTFSFVILAKITLLLFHCFFLFSIVGYTSSDTYFFFCIVQITPHHLCKHICAHNINNYMKNNQYRVHLIWFLLDTQLFKGLYSRCFYVET